MSDPTPPARDVIAATPVPAYEDFTPDLLAAFPLTELADALRARIDAIVLRWSATVRDCIPAANRLPFDQLTDNVPNILPALADALGSTDPAVRRQLLVRSPLQGITRFQQHYDPRDLMFEDRLLRANVTRAVTDALGRPMTCVEQLALNMGLDLMSQQAVAAYVEHQSAQLRAAAEAELRYLSFLSHDLNNNLSSVTMWLQVLKTQLKPRADLAEQVASIDSIQDGILLTIGGMGRLLQAERLRHGGRQAEPRPVDLRSLITNQTRVVAPAAEKRRVRFVVDVPGDVIVRTDPDLVTLVLQNLIGNAAKFAAPGTVTVRVQRLAAAAPASRGRWAIAVADAGPGIAADQVTRIFQAFQRGTMEGEAGVGLGLAIASRAANLLGGSLDVESDVGAGSTFTLTLPPD